MSNFDLTPYQLVRPTRINWRFLKTGEDILATIRSSSLQKFLRRSEELMREHGITYTYGPLSSEEFTQWLEMYKEQTDEKGYRFSITEHWYAEKQQRGEIIERMFFTQHNRVVGSGIIVRQNKDFVTLAYKTTENISLGNMKNAKLGALIDYYFLLEASKLSAKTISAGSSRNAFGVENKYGYLEFKAKFYTPAQPSEPELVSTVPLDPDGRVLFYTEKDGILTLFSIRPQVSVPVPEYIYSASPTPFQEILY